MSKEVALNITGFDPKEVAVDVVNQLEKVAVK